MIESESESDDEDEGGQDDDEQDDDEEDDEPVDRLINAAEKGHRKRVLDLIVSGVDVNSKDGSGRTAFHQAAEHGHLELCKSLIFKGAQASIRDLCGKIALECAAGEGHLQVVMMLIFEYGQDSASGIRDDVNRALYYAAVGGHVELVSEMINKGGDPNFQREGQWNALHRAAARGHKEVVCLLLDHGASLDAPGNVSKTALYEAVANGHESIVRYLLDKGAKVDLQGSGNAVLHAAVRRPKFSHSMFVLILNQTTNKDVRNFSGESALHMAADIGHFEAVRGLCLNGAKINIRREDGMTALGIAEERAIAARRDVLTVRRTGRRAIMQQYEAKDKSYQDICNELRHWGGING